MAGRRQRNSFHDDEHTGSHARRPSSNRGIGPARSAPPSRRMCARAARPPRPSAPRHRPRGPTRMAPPPHTSEILLPHYRRRARETWARGGRPPYQCWPGARPQASQARRPPCLGSDASYQGTPGDVRPAPGDSIAFASMYGTEATPRSVGGRATGRPSDPLPGTVRFPAAAPAHVAATDDPAPSRAGNTGMPRHAAPGRTTPRGEHPAGSWGRGTRMRHSDARAVSRRSPRRATTALRRIPPGDPCRRCHPAVPRHHRPRPGPDPLASPGRGRCRPDAAGRAARRFRAAPPPPRR